MSGDMGGGTSGDMSGDMGGSTSGDMSGEMSGDMSGLGRAGGLRGDRPSDAVVQRW